LLKAVHDGAGDVFQIEAVGHQLSQVKQGQAEAVTVVLGVLLDEALVLQGREQAVYRALGQAHLVRQGGDAHFSVFLAHEQQNVQGPFDGPHALGRLVPWAQSRVRAQLTASPSPNAAGVQTEAGSGAAAALRDATALRYASASSDRITSQYFIHMSSKAALWEMSIRSNVQSSMTATFHPRVIAS